MWRKICDVFSQSGEYKNEMILNRFFAVKIAEKTTALPSFFYINMALFDFLNSQSILLAYFNFADL